jgi:hypothetical protein
VENVQEDYLLAAAETTKTTAWALFARKTADPLFLENFNIGFNHTAEMILQTQFLSPYLAAPVTVAQ